MGARKGPVSGEMSVGQCCADSNSRQPFGVEPERLFASIEAVLDAGHRRDA